MADGSRKKKRFINKPYYEGGRTALAAFVRKHRKYPDAARAAGIKGVVRLRISIDLQGNGFNVKVIKHLGYGCDEEAIRVAKLIKYTVPHTRNLKGRFHKNLNIAFGPEQKKKQKKKKIAYNYIPTQKESSAKSSSYSYSYTVRWDGSEEE